MARTTMLPTPYPGHVLEAWLSQPTHVNGPLTDTDYIHLRQ